MMVRAPCVMCKKPVAPKYPHQIQRGRVLGKSRRRHNCPHGVVCVNGAALPYGNPKGIGMNGPGFLSKCVDCRDGFTLGKRKEVT